MLNPHPPTNFFGEVDSGRGNRLPKIFKIFWTQPKIDAHVLDF